MGALRKALSGLATALGRGPDVHGPRRTAGPGRSRVPATGRVGIFWLGVTALLIWAPLIAALPAPGDLGCSRGAAGSPLTLLRFVAAGQALAAPNPAEAPPPSPVAGQALHIVIEAAQRRLYLFADGRIYKSWPVAVGTPETPTPIGHWAIKAKAVWGGAFGARWMQLTIPWGTYGIHGTNNPGSIGSRASHGCIRMFNRDVVELYGLVSAGTPVDIRGQATVRFGEQRRDLLPTLLGSDALAVQRRLLALGYDPGPIDGKYMGKSVEAVRRFQVEHNLKPTGTVDVLTANALGVTPLADDPTLRPTAPGQTPPAPPAQAEVGSGARGL